MNLSATTNPTSFSVAGQLITYIAEVRNVGTGPLIGRLEVYDTVAGSTSHPMPILQAAPMPFAQQMGYPGYPGYGQHNNSGHGGCGNNCGGGCGGGCSNPCQNQGPRPGEVMIPSDTSFSPSENNKAIITNTTSKSEAYMYKISVQGKKKL